MALVLTTVSTVQSPCLFLPTRGAFVASSVLAVPSDTADWTPVPAYNAGQTSVLSVGEGSLSDFVPDTTVASSSVRFPTSGRFPDGGDCRHCFLAASSIRP